MKHKHLERVPIDNPREGRRQKGRNICGPDSAQAYLHALRAVPLEAWALFIVDKVKRPKICGRIGAFKGFTERPGHFAVDNTNTTHNC